MSVIAFIGLGNMGAGMAANQAKAGNRVLAFDLSPQALAQAEKNNCLPAPSASEAVSEAEIIITMLPTGEHVRGVYEKDILPNAKPNALLIDCSTIDIETARLIADLSIAGGFRPADAPVSGGTAAAEAGTLAFMVGCREEDFAAISAALEPMAKAVFPAGAFGAGQAAKICNNMLLAITMIGTCEAFLLAEAIGLDAQKFFTIASQASGQNWSMTSYCPVPGPIPTTPANHDYKPGFAAAMMLKDLRLAQQAVRAGDINTPLGTLSAELYQKFCDAGGDIKDFSGIIEMLHAKIKPPPHNDGGV